MACIGQSIREGAKSMAETEAIETMGDLVQYRAENGVAFFNLNDPPANTYTYEMMQELDSFILQARMDESVQVIVITGNGEKFFSAGANIKMLSEVTPNFKYFFCLHANETLSRLEQTPKLVIAALNGHTVGGGLEIAMAADLRIARKGAGKMGLPEVSLGVLPGTGGTQRLVRIVGKSRAIELMATGTLFEFEEGHELGLIDHIFDCSSHEDFIDQVRGYASQFTTPNKASKAIGRIKRSVQSGAEIPFESALALERELQQQLFQSEDAKEGLNAYVSKRKPQFKGR
jgi:enoyl-CoA hydratase